MEKWMTRIGRAALMGLAWAAAWMPIGILISLVVDPDGSMDEPWILVGTLPGFLCGAVFSGVIGTAAGLRRLDELSLSRAAALAAVSGLLVGLSWFALAVVSDGLALWRLAVVVIASLTLLSALSAVASTLLARNAKKKRWGDASATAP